MMDDDLLWWRRPRLLAAVACVALGLALLAAGPLMRMAGPAAPPADDLGLAALDEPADAPPAEAAPRAPADLVVYVSGAVAAPDVYRLPAGARVMDAVLAAGGFGGDAAGEEVNMAAPLSDAQHVHIPRLGEAAPAQAAADAQPAGASAPGGLIDLNRAGAVDLEELPGVGQSIAERIVAYREAQGPFQSVEDLQSVTGIGEKLFAKIGPLVTVGP
jgi:competence protein ComEA